MIAITAYVDFVILVITCAFLQFRIYHRSKVGAAVSNVENAAVYDDVQRKQFHALQRLFFIPYFLSLFSDWLQGPYVYKLYSAYGYQDKQIAFLYVIGFASSAVFGTFAGLLADKYGRKLSSVAFCLIYAICCLTKISSNFYWLLIGRLMGGIATSLLFSTFESWYIFEHRQRHNFPAEWMTQTFSRATLGNALLAIVAGVVANILAESLALGPLSPFLLAVPVLLLGMTLISLKWPENYGCQQNTTSNNKNTCLEALLMIFQNEQILIIGIIQFLYESVMYMFVFLWTPVLDSEYDHAPLGMIFACFMVCMMIGSSICQMSVSPAQNQLRVTLFTALLSFLVCLLAASAFNTNRGLVFTAFLILEVSVGMYFPTISYLRSRIIPEHNRATIMNWFRLPMNTITCIGLLWERPKSHEGNVQIFAVCSALILLASLLVFRIKPIKDEQNSQTQET